jgi:zinc and cadmium transporter
MITIANVLQVRCCPSWNLVFVAFRTAFACQRQASLRPTPAVFVSHCWKVPLIEPLVILIAYCVVIVAVSLGGGWLPSVWKLSHLGTQLLMSLVGGMMIGVSLLHLLPHAVEHLPNLTWMSWSLLIGILSMLFLLRFGHVHFHGESHPSTVADIPMQGHNHDHGRHDHDSSHESGVSCSHGADESATHTHRMSWLGLFAGLALHTLFDGVALGASVTAESDRAEGTGLVLFGLGTFLAVALHKPLDALSITSVMKAGGWSARSRMVINGSFALACPAGALLFCFGTSRLEASELITGCALAFSAGAFLCIALTDLLPEALAHSHDRIKLSASMLLGVALAIGIELLPGHSHETPAGDQTAPSENNTHKHNHKGHLHNTKTGSHSHRHPANR